MQTLENPPAAITTPLVSGWRLLGVLVAAVLVGGLFFSHGAAPRGEQASAAAEPLQLTAPPVRRVIVPVDGETYVVGLSEGASQFVARDEPALRKRQAYATAEDSLGMAMMIRDGEVFIVKGQTPVEVVKGGAEWTQVRISDGVHRGKVGVVPTDLLGVLAPRPQA